MCNSQIRQGNEALHFICTLCVFSIIADPSITAKKTETFRLQKKSRKMSVETWVVRKKLFRRMKHYNHTWIVKATTARRIEMYLVVKLGKIRPPWMWIFSGMFIFYYLCRCFYFNFWKVQIIPSSLGTYYTPVEMCPRTKFTSQFFLEDRSFDL